MWTSNPYLNGPMEPLQKEYDLTNLSVEGSIPPNLNGTLFRVGSNQRFKPLLPERYHWFDGDGMVHAFELNEGKARYINRWVRTEGYQAEDRAGHALYNGLYGRSGVAQPPLPNGAPKIKAVANTNVVGMAGRILALQETSRHYYELDPVTLATTGTFDFGGRIHGTATAHPHYDHAADEFLFYTLDNEQQILVCIVASSNGTIKKEHTIHLDVKPFVHDFIFTRDYFIFHFGPVKWRVEAVDRIGVGKSSFFTDGDLTSKFLLISRHDGSTVEITDDAYQTGHFLNAFQDGNKIIVDSTAMFIETTNAHFAPEDFFPFPMPGVGASPFTMPQLTRWTIDLTTRSVRRERKGDFFAEFPRPNERYQGRECRYGYLAGIHNPKSPGAGFNCLIKYDYKNDTTQYQTLENDRDMVPGEPIYVPASDESAEDDGWLLTVWWDPATNKSELVIAAANDFTAPPRARIKLDHRMPLGFHGNWVSK